MKKFLSLILAVALVCAVALVPAAAVEPYDLIVAGTKVTSANASDIVGKGTFSYDPGTKTLTVNGSCHCKNDNVILSKISGLTIYVASAAELSCDTTTAIDTEKNLTITGPGALRVVAPKGPCIKLAETAVLTIQDAGVELKGRYGVMGYYAKSQMSLKGCDLKISATEEAACCLSGGIFLSGCAITAPADAQISNGNLKNSDGSYAKDVTVEAEKYELWITEKQVTARNAADVLENGVFAYDAAAKKLTVSGDCSGSYSMITSKLDELTVYAAKDAALTAGRSVIDAEGNQELTITGPGKLTLVGGSVGGIVTSDGTNVTIEDAALDVSGAYGIEGVAGGKLTVRNSAVHAAGEKGAIRNFGSAALDGCVITAPDGAKVLGGTVVDKNGDTAKDVTIALTEKYDLEIAGVTVTSANAADVLGNGVFSYDAATKTLTVKGSYQNTSGNLLKNRIDGLTIRAAAAAQLTGASAAVSTYGDLTITGPGKLTITGSDGGGIIAWDGATVTIENVELDVSGNWGVTGMKTNEKLIFRNCTVHAKGKANAVMGFNGGISFEDCEVIGPEGVKFNGTNIVDKDNFVAGEVTIGKPKQVTSYELWIADEQVTSDNAADVLGDGAFAYDAAANRLSVKGDCSFDKAFVIRNDVADLTVSVEKDAELSCPQDVIISQKNLTITGPGKLTLKSVESSGIFALAGATLTLDKADVDASGVWGIGGNGHGEKLVVRDSEIRAAGSEAAICDFDGGITLDGCAVAAPESAKIDGGKITDADGKVARDVTIAPAAKPEKPVNPFVDIFETDGFYDAVLWAYYAKPQITNGIDATHFGPMSTVTRGQAVTFLWRAMGEPEPATKTNPFADVPESEYYYKAILWAVEKGITVGTDATHFTPNQTCSTAHIITFLYRTLGIGTDGWYEAAGAWAKAAGLLDGLTLTVAPEVDCPRADVVLFLYRQLAK